MFKTEKKCQNLDDFLFYHELKWESETKCLIIASPGNLHCIKVLGVRFSNPVKKLTRLQSNGLLLEFPRWMISVRHESMRRSISVWHGVPKFINSSKFGKQYSLHSSKNNVQIYKCPEVLSTVTTGKQAQKEIVVKYFQK